MLSTCRPYFIQNPAMSPPCTVQHDQPQSGSYTSSCPAPWPLPTSLPFQVSMIGHSQGGTLLLMLLARHPDFGVHVDAVVTLAPCVHIKYMQSLLLVPFCKVANVSEVEGSQMSIISKFIMSAGCE